MLLTPRSHLSDKPRPIRDPFANPIDTVLFFSPGQGICSDHGTTLPKAALGWMYHHSQLSGGHGDAVIVCGSSVQQIEANMKVSVDTEPLSTVCRSVHR